MLPNASTEISWDVEGGEDPRDRPTDGARRWRAYIDPQRLQPSYRIELRRRKHP
jgi:hypothetical protein